MKVGGSRGPAGTQGTRGASPSRLASGSFKLDEAGAVPAPVQASAVSEASALGALIALQSEGRGSAKNRAVAERALLLMERLQRGLLNGRIAIADLVALADAASAKLQDPDEKMSAIHGEIALRARVELAKLGRS